VREGTPQKDCCYKGKGRDMANMEGIVVVVGGGVSGGGGEADAHTFSCDGVVLVVQSAGEGSARVSVIKYRKHPHTGGCVDDQPGCFLVLAVDVGPGQCSVDSRIGGKWRLLREAQALKQQPKGSAKRLSTLKDMVVVVSVCGGAGESGGSGKSSFNAGGRVGWLPRENAKCPQICFVSNGESGDLNLLPATEPSSSPHPPETW
jgi:hypothetical protein